MEKLSAEIVGINGTKNVNGKRCAGYYFEMYDVELCGPNNWQPRFPYLVLSPHTSFSVYIQRSMIMIYAIY